MKGSTALRQCLKMASASDRICFKGVPFILCSSNPDGFVKSLTSVTPAKAGVTEVLEITGFWLTPE